MPEKVIGASPVFVTVEPSCPEVELTVWDGNTSDCGFGVIVWTAVSPTPVKVTLCGSFLLTGIGVLQRGGAHTCRGRREVRAYGARASGSQGPGAAIRGNGEVRRIGAGDSY